MESLLDKAPALPGMELSAEQAHGLPATVDTLGQYSGARFFSESPGLYGIVAALIKEGLSDAAISRAIHCHEHTSAAIRRRESQSLSGAEYSRVQVARLRSCAMQSADRIAERLADDEAVKDIPVKDLAQVLDKVSHHERLISGEPTEIIKACLSVGVDPALRSLLSLREVDEINIDAEVIHSPEISEPVREADAADPEAVPDAGGAGVASGVV